MPYKVFLVEDEIAAREGMRNTVDWGSIGFEFCGEAPDGEVALPRIEACKPDVLITDIKMPFMDGLQLSKIVREQMPWVKIIILSGHDEFEYAQTALKIGVTQYLLKPVSAADIADALTSLAVSLDQERTERESLKQLQSQAAYNLDLRREQLLLRLLMGGIPSGEAIEQGQHLGLNLVAQHYLVLLVKIELDDGSKPYDYDVYRHIEDAVLSLVGNNPDVLRTKMSPEELILILKGDDAVHLSEEGAFWTELIQKENADNAVCRLRIEMGSSQERLSDLHRSFSQALVRARNPIGASPAANSQPRELQIELPRIDHRRLEDYLKFGDLTNLDGFFESDLHLICEAALHSDLVKHYVFLEVILTVAQFLSDLGDECRLTPEIQEIEQTLQQLTSATQVEAELKRVVSDALVVRDAQANRERTMIIHQARAYIDEHFGDPELRMNVLAQEFNLSPNYFSTVFSQEIGQPFRDYLNNLRINHAKELLRTTDMTCAEVAYQCGYNDAHYFYTFFKRKTGLTPQRFRGQTQPPQA